MSDLIKNAPMICPWCENDVNRFRGKRAFESSTALFHPQCSKTAVAISTILSRLDEIEARLEIPKPVYPSGGAS